MPPTLFTLLKIKERLTRWNTWWWSVHLYCQVSHQPLLRRIPRVAWVHFHILQLYWLGVFLIEYILASDSYVEHKLGLHKALAELKFSPFVSGRELFKDYGVGGSSTKGSWYQDPFCSVKPDRWDSISNFSPFRTNCHVQDTAKDCELGRIHFKRQSPFVC